MSVLGFQLDGMEEQQDWLEITRQRILAGIRFGMAEGMEKLAVDVAGHLQGDPIQTRTGDLQGAVLRSPRVIETESEIIGEVSTQSAKFRNKGLWLEFGTKYPTTGRGLDSYPAHLLVGRIVGGGNSRSVAALGHGAYRIEPHPFFNPTFEADYPTILEVIQERIGEACGD